uniref:(northern house mosquito) hypothetical protein n=1 Tax=Culex pipiens TaxID=7175 RepID=A0A8D8PG26_CULPI
MQNTWKVARGQPMSTNPVLSRSTPAAGPDTTRCTTRRLGKVQQFIFWHPFRSFETCTRTRTRFEHGRHLHLHVRLNTGPQRRRDVPRRVHSKVVMLRSVENRVHRFEN